MKKRAFLPFVLAFIAVLFVGILVGVYAISRNTNVVILDEHGKPRP